MKFYSNLLLVVLVGLVPIVNTPLVSVADDDKESGSSKSIEVCATTYRVGSDEYYKCGREMRENFMGSAAGSCDGAKTEFSKAYSTFTKSCPDGNFSSCSAQAEQCRVCMKTKPDLSCPGYREDRARNEQYGSLITGAGSALDTGSKSRKTKDYLFTKISACPNIAAAQYERLDKEKDKYEEDVDKLKEKIDDINAEIEDAKQALREAAAKRSEDTAKAVREWEKDILALEKDDKKRRESLGKEFDQLSSDVTMIMSIEFPKAENEHREAIAAAFRECHNTALVKTEQHMKACRDKISAGQLKEEKGLIGMWGKVGQSACQKRESAERFYGECLVDRNHKDRLISVENGYKLRLNELNALVKSKQSSMAKIAEQASGKAASKEFQESLLSLKKDHDAALASIENEYAKALAEFESKVGQGGLTGQAGGIQPPSGSCMFAGRGGKIQSVGFAPGATPAQSGLLTQKLECAKRDLQEADIKLRDTELLYAKASETGSEGKTGDTSKFMSSYGELLPLGTSYFNQCCKIGNEADCARAKEVCSKDIGQPCSPGTTNAPKVTPAGSTQ